MPPARKNRPVQRYPQKSARSPSPTRQCCRLNQLAPYVRTDNVGPPGARLPTRAKAWWFAKPSPIVITILRLGTVDRDDA